ncbi:BolA/IbaG family iron-sulfur metabolism protein [Halieaceae bacterium IMCC14734]|uniref:BolA/IbaG family iron-sulfur metabolism protein n=1 Tax=Candidatus Litorirhabdus singularis TaxID=2518993 RepID=A0ABT3TJF8_9GAMM|nr:BolA/IbaG family iron-sulfur metabolism protein [Candidatus Litorirhabdus singularis]MCX2982450.1 BolA/IbaG family iron-sulfur metabolism protein [Candidatus Litorirhabdus singularis]
MQTSDIEGLLHSGLKDCEVSVSGEGNHFDILVVGEIFAGLRPVKKQQMVYAVLREQIADGSIHAVNIRTFTAAEWAQQQ